MPAPIRPTPYTVQQNALSVPKGIVGYYTDAEVEKVIADAIAGIVSGDLTQEQIDAILAQVGAAESAITVHEGPVPQPAGPIPQALEDAFVGVDDGLHYFKDAGALVSVVRQALQTTITITGPTKSVAKIVKSSIGAATPENPSFIVQQEADGKWMKLTSDELTKPFGPPQMVDIFALTGGDGVVDVLGAIRDQFIQPKGINVGEGGIAFQDIYSFSVQNVGIGPRPVIEYRDGAQAKTLVGLTRDDAYTKPEVDNLLDGKTPLQDFFQFQSLFGSYESASDEKFRLLDQGLGFANTALKNLYTKPEVDAKIDAIGAGAGASIDIVSENLSNGLVRVAALESGKADKADTYTKQEVDDKLEADKDFSIANDNVLLASITSLQEVVNNLGELGTGQIDVLAAIKGVEIEPSSVKLTGDAASPIAWKGGLSLAPVKEGANWRLGWTDGKNTHTLLHADELTSESIVAGLSGQDIFISNLYLDGTAITFGGPGGPAIALTDSGVVWAPDSNNPNDLRKLVTADELPKPVDLSAYAKKVDAAQNIVANGIVAKGYTFGDAISGSNPGLVYTDLNEGYGQRLVFDTQSGPEYLIYGSDLSAVKSRMDALESKAAPATDAVDLAPYAKLNDPAQNFSALVIRAKMIGFPGVTAVCPTISCDSQRIVLDVDGKVEKLAHLSDLVAYKEATDLLRGQLQDIFSSIYTREEADARYAPKGSAAGGSGDLTDYAKLNDANQTIVADIVQASRLRLSQNQSLILLVSNGVERPVYRDGTKNHQLAFISDLAGYCTIADAAAQINLCAKKTELTSLADTVQVIFTNTYTKTESDELLKAYLPITTFTTWGANFYTKQVADTRFQTIAGMAVYAQAATVTAQFDAFQRNILEPNYALKSEVPGAGVWKALPLRAGFSTAAAGGRQAQYRIQFGYIELRGEVNRTGDYALDTEYVLADLPVADRPAQWVYGNGATYNGGNPALPGVCHVGIKSTGEVIAVPLIRACIRLYLDNVRVSTFK